MKTIRFIEKTLPAFELPAKVPEISAEVHRKRFQSLEAARKRGSYDCLLVYADREHSANLSWLTGFDPRFEEALWIQGPSRTPVLLAGNECLPFAKAQLKLEAILLLYQQLSLPDQPRSESNDLDPLLRQAGLKKGMRCGVIGWKPMTECDVPYWIVAAVQRITGALPENATALLVAAPDGLRLPMEPEMIRLAEYGACIASSSVKAWVMNLREGISERDSAGHLQSYGLELSCHPMVNFGPSIPSGLKSPRNAVARRGEYAQCAFGVIGSLTCRAARLADSRTPDADGYLALVENYLNVVWSWYAALRTGAAAGDVASAALSAKNDEWEPALNPGHLIHLDEWVASPFTPGSKAPLRSACAIQQDIIPAPVKGPAVVNMEDGLVLADGELQEQLKRMDPKLMDRCMRRRDFMRSLGYQLSNDVLPLSNIAGAFFPWLLQPGIVAAISGTG